MPTQARLEETQGLAVLTIDAPPLNLLDEKLLTDLEAALDDVDAIQPRALLIRAEGWVVSGGVDVHAFARLHTANDAEEFFAELVGVTRRVANLPAPTVFAAHGLCLTWAFEVALACDLLLGAESASFGLVERVIGLTPAMGGTQRLAETAGPARARHIVMTGDRFDADTLERWNIVSLVLPDAGFDAAVQRIAHDLADGPTLAHRATKEVLRAHATGGVDRADHAVPAIAGALFATTDLQQGIESFLREGAGHAVFGGH